MQETKDCLLDRLIVELSGRLDLTREQRIVAPVFEDRRYFRRDLLAISRKLRSLPLLSPRRLARTTIDRLRSDRRPS